jgi:MFS family permease
VVVIVATTLTGITTNSMIGPALPEILDAFDAPTSASGWIVAAGSLPGIVVAPIVGFLADRYGRREILVPSLVVFGLAGTAAAFSPSLEVLVGLRLLQGAGSAGLINLAVVVIGDHWSGTGRTRMIGRNSAVLTMGLAVFPLLSGVLVDLGGWRLAFAVFPVGLLTAGFVAVSLGHREGDPVDLVEQYRHTRPALVRRSFLATLTANFVVFVLIFGALLTIVPVLLGDEFALSGTARGVVLALPAIGAATGSLLTGPLSSRWSMRGVLTAGSLLFAVALVGLAAAGSLVVLVPAIVVFGLGEGLMVPSLQNLAASAGDDSQRGTLVATLVGSARLGQTTGPLTLGLLADLSGARTGFAVGAGAALLVLPVLVRVAARSGPEPSGAPEAPEGARS